MSFKQFCSPHVHVSSLDSASTPQAFVKRELELGSKTLTTTDHGSLVACRQVYKLAKKAGLIPVVGVEGYFQDFSCERAKRSKYYHVTIHCPTQHCFEVVTKRISRADVERGQQAGSERKPIFTWEDLEEIAAAGATFGSGCLVGMVQRHLADSDDPEMAQKYFERLMGMAPERFFVEVFPHRTDRNWMSGVRVVDVLGRKFDYRSKKKLRLDGGEIHVDDLPKMLRKDSTRHNQIRAVMENRKWVELEEPIVVASAEAVNDFVKNDCSPWAPDGDSQEGANRFVLEMAKKHKIPVLVSDDCLAVGTIIRCLDKYRPIEDVRPGQKVLSHDGQWVEVEATRGFFTKKQCVSVHVAGFPVTMTVDHRVWVRKVPVSTWMVPMNKLRHTIPEWGDAGDLKKGDFVYIPAPPIVGGVDSRSFDMVEFVNHRWRFTTSDDRVEVTNHLNGERVWFKRHLVVDERLAWILGFFVGDGNAHNNTSSFVCDNETYDKILRSRLIDFTAEYNFSWDEKRLKTYAVFRIVNTAFTQFLRKNFYDASKEKRVPEWVRGMTASWQAKFLTGLMYADGSGTNSSNYSLSVTSLDVAGYARDTGLALGAYSILSSRRTTGSVRDLYTVGFSQEIEHACDLWLPLSGPRGKARWIRDEGGFWVRIMSVEPAGSDLLVYDLQVAETGSFCTSTFAVHNSHFTHPRDKVVQDVRLGAGSNGAWRMYSSYHRMSSEEAFAHFHASLGTSEKEFEGWVDNSLGWAELFKGFSLKAQPQLPTNFYPGDPVERLFGLIAAEGRFNPDDSRQVERLRKELDILHYNGKIDLIPYFFVTQEVVKLYERNGKLTGPGRGSAAGLLTAYLLGITHVDPIRYGLSTERFITKERILSGKMPDIDQDLPDRVLLEGDGDGAGWLRERFGRHVAQIGALTSMKLRSSIKDVCRVMLPGSVPAEVEELTARMLKPPQGVDDAKFVFGYVDDEDVRHEGSITYDAALIEFVSKYPAQWEVAQKCLGLTRQRTRHPCGFAIASREIDDLVPLTVVGADKSVTTSFPADGCEDAGIIKYDFLTVNSVRDIDQCLKLIRARTPGWESMSGPCGVRSVPFRGRLHDVWDLPNDPAVFRELASGRTETVFQLCTPSAKKWLKSFNHDKPDGTPVLGSVEAITAFVALDRPGPLNAELTSPDGGTHNMMTEYARRARGQQGSPDINKKFDKLFPETYSLPVYQEQIEKLTQEMAGISASEAVELRGLLAKKKKDEVEKWRPRFVHGATKVLGSEEEAGKLWALVYNYAQYSFNKSVAAGTILESCNGGRKAIEHFLPGDEIRGVDSYGTVITTQVVGLHDHGELEAYEVMFDDGFVVVTSARHKFLTLSGQTPLHEIVVRGLEVLADARKQRRLENEVWCGCSEQSNAASTSEGVFPLSQCEASWGTKTPGTRCQMWGGDLADTGRCPTSKALSQVSCNALTSGEQSRMECALWSSVFESDLAKRSSTHLRGLSSDQKEEHPGEDDSYLEDAGSEGGMFSDRKTNLCASGDTAATRGASECVEREESRTPQEYDQKSSESRQTEQGGSMAQEQWSSDVAGGPGELRHRPKAGGFCFKESLGRSGRLLPLLRGFAENASSGACSRA